MGLAVYTNYTETLAKTPAQILASVPELIVLCMNIVSSLE